MLKERENLFYNPPKNYTPVYFNRETGGLVLQHSQHNLNQINGELQIAKLYADKEGVLVELLPERKQGEGVKTPDARHNQKDIWQYKSITEKATNLRTAADRHIRDVIDKSNGLKEVHIAILIDRQKYDIQEINRGILFGLDKDEDSKILTISLIFRDKLQSIKIKGWIDGKRFSRF